MIGMDNEWESGKSVLSVWLEDDSDYIYNTKCFMQEKIKDKKRDKFYDNNFIKVYVSPK